MFYKINGLRVGRRIEVAKTGCPVVLLSLLELRFPINNYYFTPIYCCEFDSCQFQCKLILMTYIGANGLVVNKLY